MQNVIHKSVIPARADIETPLPLCRYLTDLILSVMTPKVILDPCAGNDNLTHYFSDQKFIRFEICQQRSKTEPPQRLKSEPLRIIFLG